MWYFYCNIFQDLQEQFGHDALTIYNWDYLALWRRLVDNNCAYKEHEDKLAALLPHRDWADGELGKILQGIEYIYFF